MAAIVSIFVTVISLLYMAVKSKKGASPDHYLTRAERLPVFQYLSVVNYFCASILRVITHCCAIESTLFTTQ